MVHAALVAFFAGDEGATLEELAQNGSRPRRPNGQFLSCMGARDSALCALHELSAQRTRYARLAVEEFLVTMQPRSAACALKSRVPANESTRIGVVRARVYVTFKPSVLDPQGQTIRAALNGLGHRGIDDVRQGKYFEITMQPGEDLDAIARDVLSNPVIEDYRIEMLD